MQPRRRPLLRGEVGCLVVRLRLCVLGVTRFRLIRESKDRGLRVGGRLEIGSAVVLD